MTDMPPRDADRPGPDEAKRRKGRIQAAIVGILVVVALVGTVAMIAVDSLGSEPSEETTQVKVVIDYDGRWFGSLGSPESLASYNGTGPATYIVPQDSTGSILVSALIQKSDGDHHILRVSIEKMDGTVLQTSSTVMAYDWVSVGWTNL